MASQDGHELQELEVTSHKAAGSPTQTATFTLMSSDVVRSAPGVGERNKSGESPLEQTLLEDTSPTCSAGGDDGLESVIDSPIIADNAFDADSQSPKLPISQVIPNTSIYKSAFHIFKGNVGTGIFLLPTIYNDAGYIGGPCIAIFCGCMVIDSTMMLLRAKKKINRDDVQTYPQVAGFTFGNVFRMMVTTFIVLTQVGFCLMYMQFAAGLLESIVSFHEAYKLYVFFTLLIVFPMTLLSNNLSLLGISSAIATGCVFFCIFSTFEECVRRISSDFDSSLITPVAPPQKWVLYIASSMSVLEGIALVLPVENACKDKEKVAPMVKLVLAGIVCLYLLYGMVGYFAFGSSISVSVVNVLPMNTFTIVIRIALICNLLMTYPLQFVPAIQIIDRALKIEKHRVLGSSRAIAARVMINSGMAIVAMVIGGETVGLMLAFIGSIAATFLAVVMPAMLELQVDHAIQSHEKRAGWKYFSHMFTAKPLCSIRKVKCYIYIVVGLLTMVVGTITCIFDATQLAAHKHGRSSDEIRNQTKLGM